MYRVLLRLCKGEGVKYLSHRDIIRSFEFALRRAQIPVAYSDGFNPRVRMSFGSAIGVGVTSDDDRILLELSAPWEASDIKETLNKSLPPGIQVISADIIPDGQKSPISTLKASEFRITMGCKTGCTLDEVKVAIEKLFASDSVRVQRQREDGVKEVEIRPHLISANPSMDEDGNIIIDVALSAGDSGGAGPKDFIKALDTLIPNMSVRKLHRLRQMQRESKQ